MALLTDEGILAVMRKSTLWEMQRVNVLAYIDVEFRQRARHRRCTEEKRSTYLILLRLLAGEEKGIMKRTYLKRFGASLGPITLVALVFFVSGSAQTDAVKFTDATSYYKDGKCVVCHGQKAEKKFESTKKDEELVEIILKGKKPEKPPNMPSYEAKGLTAEQAKAMVEYMRSLNEKPAS